MWTRCYCETSKAYPYYGGKGVQICEEWRTDFSAFAGWALANGYDDSLTIDRIDSDGDYTPINCQWIPPSENYTKQYNTRQITIGGETRTLNGWLRHFGLNPGTYLNRVKRFGWSVEKALTTPPEKQGYTITFKGKTQTLGKWARELGLNYATVKGRFRRGLPIDEVLRVN